MKRDMDLVRKILFSIEELPTGFPTTPIAVDGYDEKTIGYHIHLMMDGGLLTGANITGFGDDTPTAVAESITWKGHEFMDAARSDRVWERAKAIVARAGGATFPVWIETLTRVAFEHIKL